MFAAYKNHEDCSVVYDHSLWVGLWRSHGGFMGLLNVVHWDSEQSKK